MEDSVRNSKQNYDGKPKLKLSKLTILERALLIPIGIIAYIIGAIISTIKNYYEAGYDNHDD